MILGMYSLETIFCYTVQSLYNTHPYNTDLETTRSSCGSQFFLPWNFTDELKENDPMVIFLELACKPVPLKHGSLITRSISMNPKQIVIKGLHLIYLKKFQF